jgi:glycosyltransferase involved in cell wall biosynthesis
MPTKASEYMISGTPIIIFAPEVTAIVKYAKEYGWAKVVTENQIEDLSKAIEELIQDPLSREKFAKNAIAIAENNHDAKIVTSKFREAISSLVPSKNLVG